MNELKTVRTPVEVRWMEDGHERIKTFDSGIQAQDFTTDLRLKAEIFKSKNIEILEVAQCTY